VSHQCACGEPIADTAVIGARCVSQLMQDLAEIPALSDELDTVLSRQTAGGKHEAGKSAEKPLPYDVGASEALSDLRAKLVGWVQVLHAREPWPRENIPSMSRWMLTRIVRIAHHAEGATITDEIHQSVKFSQSRTLGAIYRTRARVGRCPVMFEGFGRCKGTVLALVPHEPDKDSILLCEGCGAEWPINEWHNVGRQIMGAA
jgi:hypothetical protein